MIKALCMYMWMSCHSTFFSSGDNPAHDAISAHQ